MPPGLPVPEDFPLADLMDRRLTRLRIGSHLLYLEFERDAKVEIEAGFVLRTSDGARLDALNGTLATQSGSLGVRLNQTVTAVERVAGNGLLIRFSRGASLELITDPIGYGSYHLHASGKSITIAKPWQAA